MNLRGSLISPQAMNKLNCYIHLEVTRRRVSVVRGGDGVNALHGRSCRQGQESPAEVVVVLNPAAVLKKPQFRKVRTSTEQEPEEMVQALCPVSLSQHTQRALFAQKYIKVGRWYIHVLSVHRVEKLTGGETGEVDPLAADIRPQMPFTAQVGDVDAVDRDPEMFAGWLEGVPGKFESARIDSVVSAVVGEMDMCRRRQPVHKVGEADDFVDRRCMLRMREDFDPRGRCFVWGTWKRHIEIVIHVIDGMRLRSSVPNGNALGPAAGKMGPVKDWPVS